MTHRTHADLGGALGHGPIVHEPEGVVFHDDWEARALALTLAAGAAGGWNIDMSRSARETLPDYADRSYYEIWQAALERLVVDHGLATADEVAAGHAAGPGDPSRRALRADEVAEALRRGGPSEREPSGPARFTVGDRVQTRAGTVDHHTRLPAYAAGRVGVVEHHRVQPRRLLAEAVCVRVRKHMGAVNVFDAADLWPDARSGDRVSIDAWEPYLEAAT